MSNYLFKNINDVDAAQFRETGSIRLTSVPGSFTSATDSIETLRSEFGEHTLRIDPSKLPEGALLTKVQYDFAWLTQSKLHLEILSKITSRTEQDWLDWAKVELGLDASPGQLVDAIDDEIQTLYGDEAEVVISGLSCLSSDFADIRDDNPRERPNPVAG